MNTKEIRKRKGFYFCLLAFTSVLLLLLLSVVSLFWPTRRFSASERRNLAQRPKLSYEGIVDGTFSNEVESYLADQYPARDIWVYLNSLQNRILGIDYQNGIYRGKDGYLIQGFEKSEIDKEDQEKQKILNSFLERNAQLQSYVMLVPTASWILKDLLPSGAPQWDEKSWYESWISTSKISQLLTVQMNWQRQQRLIRFIIEPITIGQRMVQVLHLKSLQSGWIFPMKKMILRHTLFTPSFREL